LRQLQQGEEKPVVPRHHELLIIFARDKSKKKVLNFSYESSATKLATFFAKVL
jgi:hypothetical protein